MNLWEIRPEDLKIALQKFAKFNTWEVKNYRSISCQKRLWQFLVLFDMASYYPDEMIEKAHREHLNSLIESQSRLMKVRNVKS